MIDSSYVTAGDLRFYVATAGPSDGPMVVLLHGFPEMSYAWRAQIGPLAQAGFRVVAPDQRGYGWSDKPTGTSAYALDVLADDIVRLARACGRDRVRLVGHDWGGVVAWALASRNDGFVERAAILNAPHPATLWAEMLRHPTQALRSSYIGLFQLPGIAEAVLRARDFQALAFALTATSRPGTFDDEALAVYRQAWVLPGALTGMLNWYRALYLAPNFGTEPISTPVLLLWGDRDSALNCTLADRALERCERGELHRFPEATHWLHHEEPAGVNRLLIDFLGD